MVRLEETAVDWRSIILEIFYCGRLHAEIFPALTDLYGDQVRVVYRSFPSEGHPWAMHATVDTD